MQFLKPEQLEELVRGLPLEGCQVVERQGCDREGTLFPMGHQLEARFDGAALQVSIDLLPAVAGEGEAGASAPPGPPPGYQVRWSFPAERPTVDLFVLQRRGPGVTWRGLKTGWKELDRLFRVNVEPASALSVVLDAGLVAQVCRDGVALLDTAVAIGDPRRGKPGLSTFFLVRHGITGIPESFSLTLELRRRWRAPR
jgi:hypothetical protein